MELLHKTIVDPDDRRHDNGDKKALFEKEQHPHTAAFHREQWAFIADETIKENIAYQMKYLEFLTRLYNEYQIYLTVCKGPLLLDSISATFCAVFCFLMPPSSRQTLRAAS